MADQEIQLEATFVYMQNDGDVAMLGFTDDQYNTTKYVLLTRTLDPSEDDIQRDWDQAHIEVDDQLWSTYGGITEATLTGGTHLLIRLAPSAAVELKGISLIHIDFAKAGADADAVARMLALVCGECVRLR